MPIEGAEHAIISDDILDLPELPKKLAIIGGGYIALEFAGIYNHFGSETHVIYRQVCCRRMAVCVMINIQLVSASNKRVPPSSHA